MAVVTIRLEFKILRGVIPWETVTKGKDAQNSWLIFKDDLLRAQEWSFGMYGKLSKHDRISMDEHVEPN